MESDQEIINRWRRSAPFWEKHREIIRRMFAPVTQALVEDGQIGGQHAVLDIATGPGEPALSVAALVGPKGKVFGIDPAPGRKLAMAVWHFAERNPFHYTLSRVIERYVDSPPPAQDAPDAFRFASPGKLGEILTEAGAIATSERVLQFSIQAPISIEDFWTLRCEMSEMLREKIAILSEEQMTEVKRQVFEALREYSTDGGLSFPAEVLIVSGARRHPA